MLALLTLMLFDNRTIGVGFFCKDPILDLEHIVETGLIDGSLKKSKSGISFSLPHDLSFRRLLETGGVKFSFPPKVPCGFFWLVPNCGSGESWTEEFNATEERCEEFAVHSLKSLTLEGPTCGVAGELLRTQVESARAFNVDLTWQGDE